MTSDDARARALRLLETNFACKTATAMGERAAETAFASEFGALAVDHVFAAMWTRDGLDLRSRSLVTLGILIALGASQELAIHGVVALNNGLTLTELEEVLYHSAGYAGFARASAAREVIAESLLFEGRIEKVG